MSPYVDYCKPDQNELLLLQKTETQDSRVSLWSLNILQKERETENEAWLDIIRI